VTSPRLITILAAAAALAAAAPAAADVLPAKALDGPSNDVAPNNSELDYDLDVAPDGTGAVAYLKKVGAKHEVFVVRRTGGQWGTPEQVSAAISTASNVAVAAGNNGRVVVTWLDGPGGYRLTSAIRPAAATPWVNRQIIGNLYALQQDVDMNAAGVAYVVYASYPTAAGRDLRAARLDDTTWSFVGGDGDALAPGGVLDQTVAEEVGDNSQAGPHVAVAGDGTAGIIWSEGQVGTAQKTWMRRLTGTAAGPAVQFSTVVPGADALAGTSDMTNAAADASGAVWAVARDVQLYGAKNVGRVVARRLVGDTLSGAQVLDGLPSPPPEAGEFPTVDVSAAGRALAATPRQLTFDSIGAVLTEPTGTWAAPVTLNTAPSAATGRPDVAIAADGTGLFTWLQTIGTDQTVKARTVKGTDLAGVIDIADPAFGAQIVGTPITAASGDGTAAIAFVQGAAATKRLVVGEVDIPPAKAGGGGGGGADDVAPVVSRVRVKRSELRFRLSEAATVQLTLTRKHGMPRTTTFAAKAGANARRVRPGRLRVALVATDAAGNASEVVTKRFKKN
jgi:hypothetical protein